MSDYFYGPNVRLDEMVTGKDEHGELVCLSRYVMLDLDPANKSGHPAGTVYDRKTGRYHTPYTPKGSWGGDDPRWGGTRVTPLAVHSGARRPENWT